MSAAPPAVGRLTDQEHDSDHADDQEADNHFQVPDHRVLDARPHGELARNGVVLVHGQHGPRERVCRPVRDILRARDDGYQQVQRQCAARNLQLRREGSRRPRLAHPQEDDGVLFVPLHRRGHVDGSQSQDRHCKRPCHSRRYHDREVDGGALEVPASTRDVAAASRGPSANGGHNDIHPCKAKVPLEARGHVPRVARRRTG